MGPFRDPCVVTYRFVCSICKRTEESAQCQVSAGGNAFVVNAPEGWISLFGNTLLCPDHKVETVLIDGKPLDEPNFYKTKDLPFGPYWVRWRPDDEWVIAEKDEYGRWRSSGIPGNVIEPSIVGVPIPRPGDWDSAKLGDTRTIPLERWAEQLPDGMYDLGARKRGDYYEVNWDHWHRDAELMLIMWVHSNKKDIPLGDLTVAFTESGKRIVQCWILVPEGKQNDSAKS